MKSCLRNHDESPDWSIGRVEGERKEGELPAHRQCLIAGYGGFIYFHWLMGVIKISRQRGFMHLCVPTAGSTTLVCGRHILCAQ